MINAYSYYVADHGCNEDMIQFDIAVNHVSETSARTVVAQDVDVGGVDRRTDEQIEVVVAHVFQLTNKPFDY